ncbi:ROK family protein, partial [Vibrio sp. Vb0974]|uniref:ROK family protein n=1 Tax=Vibrio sp. Vb0974 TaxID=3074635 RepID=UPI00296531D4
IGELGHIQIDPNGKRCHCGNIGCLETVASSQAIREEVGATSIDQVIYAWVRRLPSKPIPIIGSGKIERVQTAVNALNIELTREQWYRVWVASKGHGVP